MTDDVFLFVRREEGGYVNDPDDSGGATKGGVTQGTYDLYRKAWKLEPRPVRYITAEEIKKVYTDFFKTAKCDKLPLGLDLMHFDFSINAGPVQANKTLQRTLGVTVDGIVGPKTLAKAWSENVLERIEQYAEARREFYRGLAERRPKDRKFLRGWINRVNRCEKRAISLYGTSTPVLKSS